jgi:hypothetical protein
MKAGLVAATFNQNEDELEAGFAVLSKHSLRFRKSTFHKPEPAQ